MSRTVVGDTKTPIAHTTIAIRWRPQVGFWLKTSQTREAISSGVLFAGSLR
ncbi:MAG: hypothetical protein OEV33_02395 [Armatimonadota bacterium]|nr:hypothetical protein [Armatimonadota bacterium]